MGSALEAAETLNASVANMRFVKPLDRALILTLALSHELLVTIEDNAVQGGAGSGVAEVLCAENISVPLLQLGLPDRFVDQGDPDSQLRACALDAPGLLAAVQQRVLQLNSLRQRNTLQA